MQASSIPTKFAIPFANGPATTVGSPFYNVVPLASQQGTTTPGAASLTDGFPPITFTPTGSGGIPPAGKDFNGLLYLMSAWNRWQAAGGLAPYDSAFSTAIGGYPKGAVVGTATTAVPGRVWVSLNDNNTVNPDQAGQTAWLALMLASDVLTIIGTSAVAAGYLRQRLNANTNLYVNASTGSDSNTGLTAGTAFQTMQKAWNYIQSTFDLNGYTVTVNCVGSFTQGLLASGPIVGQTGALNIIFLGNTSNPASVPVSVTNGNCFTAAGLGRVAVQGFGVAATGTGANGNGLATSDSGSIVYSSMSFGSCYRHLYASGGKIYGLGGNPASTITAGAAFHALAEILGYIDFVTTAYTLTGTPAFSSAFVFAQYGGVIVAYNGVTFSGAATGGRYNASYGGAILTAGGGANFFPGNAAGGSTAPGYYT